jgi:hypothetical protein
MRKVFEALKVRHRPRYLAVTNYEVEAPSKGQPYKKAFRVLTVLGGLMLVVDPLLDYLQIEHHGVLSVFPLLAIFCLFAASLNYAKYLSFRRSAFPG